MNYPQNPQQSNRISGNNMAGNMTPPAMQRQNTPQRMMPNRTLGGNNPYPNGPQPLRQMNGPQRKAQKLPKQPKKINKKKLIILGAFGLVGLIIGIFLFVKVNKYTKSMTILSLPGVSISDNNGSSQQASVSGTDTAAGDTSSVDTSNLAVAEHGQAWDGSTRITCLAMGLDLRDWEAGEKYSRTDSMMLLTYDPVTKRAGMLSIPRDLWVAIPGFDYGRINTAYYDGDAFQLPGGGPALAMQTVELFLGVDIQYYAVIDFNGFVKFIDSIDKLAINVRDDITVDPIGPANTVTLRAGVQDLDGATALAYARERKGNGDDFGRAQRQQDVIMALFDQMKWQLPQMLTKADQLYADLTQALITNLTFSDIMKIAWTVVDMDEYQISRAVIAPPDQVEFGKTADGTQDILVPIPDKIREARDKIFSTSVAAAPVTISDDQSTLIAAEGARVTLLDGSGTPGLLDQTVAFLQKYGITVVNTGTASNATYGSLEILDGKPNTAKFIKEQMQIPTSAVKMNYDPYNDVDMIITISSAWAASNTMG